MSAMVGSRKSHSNICLLLDAKADVGAPAAGLVFSAAGSPNDVTSGAELYPQEFEEK